MRAEEAAEKSAAQAAAQARDVKRHAPWHGTDCTRGRTQARGVAAKHTESSRRTALPPRVRPAPPEVRSVVVSLRSHLSSLKRSMLQPAQQVTAARRAHAFTHDAAAEAARPSSLSGARGALLEASRDLFRLHAAAEVQRAAAVAAEADAARREAALRAAEARFDEDALRFDTFLRDSDAALRAAHKAAAHHARRADETAEQLARCACKPAAVIPAC